LPERVLNDGPQPVVLAGLRGDTRLRKERGYVLSEEESMEELKGLVQTLGFVPGGVVIQERATPEPGTYFGKGKVSEIAEVIWQTGAKGLVIDGQLTPSQVRSLEDATGVTVMDRTQLILKIFAVRARSKEGKLQVELARARYELTRLTGHGEEMSNPGAGTGTRGPGEQKLEEDRRLLRRRISQLGHELSRMQKVRREQRKQRLKSHIPHASLVGYTNAGKSTLFKALTGTNVLCDDKLFATLDPWVRRWKLGSGQSILLTDTVGFIQGLPHELVAAFRSTLEESLDADVLIHVVDLSSPIWERQFAVVEGILRDLGSADIPRVTCFNKVDKVDGLDVEAITSRYVPSVPVSALYGWGLESLSEAVYQCLSRRTKTVSCMVPYSLWAIVYELREAGTVLKEEHGEEGTAVTCRLSPEDAERLQKRLSRMGLDCRVSV